RSEDRKVTDGCKNPGTAISSISEMKTRLEKSSMKPLKLVPFVLDPVIKDLELAIGWGLSENEAFKKLYAALEVEPEKGTDLITIQYWDKDPEKAAQVAQAVAESLQGYKLAMETTRSQGSLDMLQKQVKEQSDKVEKARLKMLDLAERYRIIDLAAKKNGPSMTGNPVGGVGSILMSSMSSIQAAKAALAQIRWQLETLQDLEGEELIEKVAMLDTQDATVQNLWPPYHELKSNRSELLGSGLGESHPKVKDLSGKIAKSNQMLSEAAESVRLTLQAKLGMAEKALKLTKDLKEKGGSDSAMDERRKIPDYSEASKEYELQKNMLANMQAKYATEQVDLTMPKTPITIHADAEIASRKAFLPLEQVAAASVIGVRGGDPKWLLFGMGCLGFCLGLIGLRICQGRSRANGGFG
ncbi:MAG: hypothetical protein ACI8T1_002418, partial [Verrucomicrobiales bacterium]